jgi:hypothetical protein
MAIALGMLAGYRMRDIVQYSQIAGYIQFFTVFVSKLGVSILERTGKFPNQ